LYKGNEDMGITSGGGGVSQYFDVKGRGKKPYKITINYDTGHFCTCPGMISMKSKWGLTAGKTKGTSCKHVKQVIATKFDDDWGVSNGMGKPRTRKNSSLSTPSEPMGRRAAIMAQRAARAEQELAAKSMSEKSPLMDRIAALKAAKEAVG
jgi:hypothetical protein